MSWSFNRDGFCLFDSAYTDFKSTNSPAGRDFVRQFVDAAREFGLRGETWRAADPVDTVLEVRLK